MYIYLYIYMAHLSDALVEVGVVERGAEGVEELLLRLVPVVQLVRHVLHLKKH
jgi:hypothetical protein